MLGDGYRARVISLGDDAEGPVEAVLVHRETTAPNSAVPSADAVPVLVLHGWSDYVFQRDLLEHLAALGLDVWALDLRKHGRSLRPWQTPTAVDHLEDYDEEIEEALALIGEDRRPLVLAHSTGGLIAALWAARHPGRLRGLILNSPWLEFHLGGAARTLVHAPLSWLARSRPFMRVLPQGADHYARSLHRDYGGAFDFDLDWKPAHGHPFPASTLAAILEGQSRLAAATVTEPVLVLLSTRSRFRRRWDETMRRADVVLDVRGTARAARRLGPDVLVAPVPGARHDVFLSEPDVTRTAIAILDRWLARRVPT